MRPIALPFAALLAFAPARALTRAGCRTEIACRPAGGDILQKYWAWRSQFSPSAPLSCPRQHPCLFQDRFSMWL